MVTDILRRIRERSYQLWEQEGRPAGRHFEHWLQAEQELVAKNAVEFEFKQLMRAFRSGIISETTVEQVMTDLEKRALSDGIKISSRLGDLIDRVDRSIHQRLAAKFHFGGGSGTLGESGARSVADGICCSAAAAIGQDLHYSRPRWTFLRTTRSSGQY